MISSFLTNKHSQLGFNLIVKHFSLKCHIPYTTNNWNIMPQQRVVYNNLNSNYWIRVSHSILKRRAILYNQASSSELAYYIKWIRAKIL